MKLEPVLGLLRQRTGLDPAALGPPAVRSAIRSRMRSTQRQAVADYLDLLRSDPDEFLALVDEVVVPETWFFRGGDLFSHLAEHVRAVLRSRDPAAAFRALSAPCSTGEEPWSFALALVEAGVPLERCRIDAVDLSPHAIRQARKGLFPELSFRQMAPEMRARYFRPAPPLYEIAPPPLSAVHFSVGNLLAGGFLARERPYDLIFCRNLFIYLHPEARRQAVNTLERLLAPDGLLCLGHADPLNPEEKRFQRTGPDDCFLYRRATPAAHPRPVAAPPRATVRLPSVSAAPAPVKKTAQGADDGADLLTRARRQADAGRLAEALALCQQEQRRAGPSADLHSLLGVIFQARHESGEAVRSFRKALFLDPDHPEALMHLMLIHESQGERRQAELLRRRLQRLGARQGGAP
jgi:chemotaxis protein methyltransferase WspC